MIINDFKTSEFTWKWVFWAIYKRGCDWFHKILDEIPKRQVIGIDVYKTRRNIRCSRDSGLHPIQSGTQSLLAFWSAKGRYFIYDYYSVPGYISPLPYLLMVLFECLCLCLLHLLGYLACLLTCVSWVVWVSWVAYNTLMQSKTHKWAKYLKHAK